MLNIDGETFDLDQLLHFSSLKKFLEALANQVCLFNNTLFNAKANDKNNNNDNNHNINNDTNNADVKSRISSIPKLISTVEDNKESITQIKSSIKTIENDIEKEKEKSKKYVNLDTLKIYMGNVEKTLKSNIDKNKDNIGKNKDNINSIKGLIGKIDEKSESVKNRVEEMINEYRFLNNQFNSFNEKISKNEMKFESLESRVSREIEQINIKLNDKLKKIEEMVYIISGENDNNGKNSNNKNNIFNRNYNNNNNKDTNNNKSNKLQMISEFLLEKDKIKEDILKKCVLKKEVNEIITKQNNLSNKIVNINDCLCNLRKDFGIDEINKGIRYLEELINTKLDIDTFSEYRFKYIERERFFEYFQEYKEEHKKLHFSMKTENEKNLKEIEKINEIINGITNKIKESNKEIKDKMDVLFVGNKQKKENNFAEIVEEKINKVNEGIKKVQGEVEELFRKMEEINIPSLAHQSDISSLENFINGSINSIPKFFAEKKATFKAIRDIKYDIKKMKREIIYDLNENNRECKIEFMIGNSGFNDGYYSVKYDNNSELINSKDKDNKHKRKANNEFISQINKEFNKHDNKENKKENNNNNNAKFNMTFTKDITIINNKENNTDNNKTNFNNNDKIVTNNHIILSPIKNINKIPNIAKNKLSENSKSSYAKKSINKNNINKTNKRISNVDYISEYISQNSQRFRSLEDGIRKRLIQSVKMSKERKDNLEPKDEILSEERSYLADLNIKHVGKGHFDRIVEKKFKLKENNIFSSDSKTNFQKYINYNSKNSSSNMSKNSSFFVGTNKQEKVDIKFNNNDISKCINSDNKESINNATDNKNNIENNNDTYNNNIYSSNTNNSNLVIISKIIKKKKQ